MDKKRIRNDLILLASILLAALAAWGVLKLAQRPGKYVVVEIDGKTSAVYPLDTDLRLDIKTEGGHVNTLVISEGRAYVESADCPDKLCVKQRAISRTGETVICLPHKLVIRIAGEGGVDTVS
ncbi:MAG: NusG domain II-containing protein [Clostridiales bacterium]|nr:NusG domain II-containing protein [Clostridiales bacterium]